MKKPLVTIYTDGSCQPNPGPGAWAALLVFVSPSTGEVVEREISGYEARTTNNRMEISAAIYALRTLKVPCVVTLHSDSMLVVRRGGRKRKMNLDLWAEFDEVGSRHDLTTRHVKAHSGHPENTRVDRLVELARISCGDRAVPRRHRVVAAGTGFAFECMMDGSCRRTIEECRASGRCLASHVG